MSDPENSFRQQFSNWTQRAGGPASGGTGTRSATGGGFPAFADWSDYVKNGANDLYTSLPTYNTVTGNTSTVEEPSWFKLSRFEKILGFLCCLGGSLLCFVVCFFLFPVLALKPRKFGLIWSLGSLLFVCSFGILQGPYSYTRHLVSSDRIIFTSVFFGSVLSTIYCSVVLKSTILTILASIVEIFAVAYYILSYFPFGAQTVTWFSSYLVGYVGGFLGGLL
ncbi:protein transport protein Sft2p [[Candida] railenensis]|uniref:Protein transport protein SFT2 n=1 Tax=[Candida] railenensis TaxID=45579 RepID=A0A9P0QP99_9ASCO|nr:protein transport protein Sft2p [[Candida] railenensis]